MSHNQQPLREGIESAKVGRKLMARMQLEQVLEANPQDAVAWLWLGWTADSPEQAIGYLTTALQLRPDWELAQRYLQVAADMRDFVCPEIATDLQELPTSEDLPTLPEIDESDLQEVTIDPANPFDSVDAFEFEEDFNLVPLSDDFSTPNTIDGTLDDIDRYAQADLPEPPEPFDAGVELDEWQLSEPLQTLDPLEPLPAADSDDSFPSREASQFVPDDEPANEEVVDAVEVLETEAGLEALVIESSEFAIADVLEPQAGTEAAEEFDTAIQYAMSVVDEVEVPAELVEFEAPAEVYQADAVVEYVADNVADADEADAEVSDTDEEALADEHDKEIEASMVNASAAVIAPTVASDDDLAMLADQMRAHAEAIRREPRPLCATSVEDDRTKATPDIPTAQEQSAVSAVVGSTPDVEPPTPVAVVGPIPVSEPTVLVVDDSRAVRTLVGLALQSNGYRVLLAESVASAIEVLNATRPSLVLVDDAMPQADGHQLCKWIKGNESLKTMPVILLTNKEGMFDRLRGKLVGCTEHLCKPLETAELLRRVEYHVPVAHAVA
jgi:twitching motility two-component system response regulator PilG